MGYMTFNLGYFLEQELKISLHQFCRDIGVNEIEAKSWNENYQIPNGIFSRIIKQYNGIDESIYKYQSVPPKPFDMENLWEGNRERKQKLLEMIRENPKEELKELEARVVRNWVKPRVVLMGGSDSGKSSILNGLLGERCLPEGLGPMTKIIIIVKHIDDRPEYLHKEVCFFKKGEDGSCWNPEKLDDKMYTMQFFLSEGCITDLQEKAVFSGMAQNERGSGMERGAPDCAVVFLKSKILRNCDLIDLPGFYSGNVEAAEIQGRMFKLTDILIYASAAGYGFMNDMDINAVCSYIKNMPVKYETEENQLPPLCNLFVLGTRSGDLHHSAGETFEIVRDGFVKRMRIKEPKWKFFGRGKQCGWKNMETRVFSYDKYQWGETRGFYLAFKDLLQRLPAVIDQRSRDAVSPLVSDLLNRQKALYKRINDILHKNQDLQQGLEYYRVESEKYQEGRMQLQQQIKLLVENAQITYGQCLDSLYQNIFSVRNIKKVWDEKNFSWDQDGGIDTMYALAASLEENIMQKTTPLVEKVASDYKNLLFNFYGKAMSVIYFENESEFAADLHTEPVAVYGESALDGGWKSGLLSAVAVQTGAVGIICAGTMLSSICISIVIAILESFYTRHKCAKIMADELQKSEYKEIIRKQYLEIWQELLTQMQQIEEEYHSQIVTGQQALEQAIKIRKEGNEKTESLLSEKCQLCERLKKILDDMGK